MALEQHTSCAEPESDQVPEWRFVGLAKLLDLFRSESLYFSRLDTIEDPYEGRPSPFYMSIARAYPASGLSEDFASHVGDDWIAQVAPTSVCPSIRLLERLSDSVCRQLIGGGAAGASGRATNRDERLFGVRALRLRSLP
jgi:hypothetical protein